MIQKDAEQESEMRTEIQGMKMEQSSISMMDEFAKYARLERKINKTTDKLKTHGEMQMGVRDSQIRAGAELRFYMLHICDTCLIVNSCHLFPLFTCFH